MANALGALFSDIADSIREKTGETGKMKPADFPAAIDGIVMKADPVLAELSVSENGLYVPGEGVDGFGSVMVNVEEGSSGSGSSLFDDILDVINGEVIGETPYTVTFIGAAGEKLHSTQVLEQQNCDDPVENDTIDAPTKAPTTTKIFTYAGGWSLTNGGDINPDALKNITEDRTVYAVFTEEVRKYTIEYYDGDTLLDFVMREYGDTLADYTPEKDGYNFVAWQPEVTTVTGDAKYYAQWEEVVVAGTLRVGKTSASCKASVLASTAFNAQGTWTAVTWTGLPTNEYPAQYYTWSDGRNVYHRMTDVLPKGTTAWEDKSWNGTATINAGKIWTDGTYIYSSDLQQYQYVLNTATSTWSTKTWSGFNDLMGQNVWTDGTNIYYSASTNHYVLNKETSTWTTKTWSGMTNFNGNNIWTDGTDTYYSNGTVWRVLNKETSTWTTKQLSGASSIYGSSIWTDGENIYHSGGTATSQYRFDKETGTWSAVSWDGISNPSGENFWTDGVKLYYSSGSSNQFVLST